MKKLKRIGVEDWWLQNSDGNVEHSTENTVNNIVITVYGARWVLDLSEDHFVNYINF